MGPAKQPLPGSIQQQVDEMKAELKHAMIELLEPRGCALLVSR